MRYHNITKDDMLNGDGLRVVLWVAGCNHCCRDCQNPITWDPNGGLAFTEAEETEIFTELDKDPLKIPEQDNLAVYRLYMGRNSE